MGISFVTEIRGDGRRGTGPTGNNRPPATVIKPEKSLTPADLKDAHMRLVELTKTSQTKEERLFRELKRILTAAAENRIPEDDDILRPELKTMKAIDKLVKKGKRIPEYVLTIYRTNRDAIERNLKQFLIRKYGGHDDKINLPPSSKPEDGIKYLCKKAKLALIFV